MKWTIRMLTMIGVSAVIALGLSLLPRVDSSINSTASDSWMGKRAVQLTDRNLADLIIGLPLQLRIRKVELNHSILSIDLNLPKHVDESSVYRDLYSIAQYTIAKTSNVNQVLVRIMDYSGGAGSSSSQLVLAMEADRENAKNMDADSKEGNAIGLEQQLKTRFHLTYTPRWQQRYPL